MSHWIDVDELPPSKEKDILVEVFEELFGKEVITDNEEQIQNSRHDSDA